MSARPAYPNESIVLRTCASLLAPSRSSCSPARDVSSCSYRSTSVLCAPKRAQCIASSSSRSDCFTSAALFWRSSLARHSLPALQRSSKAHGSRKRSSASSCCTTHPASPAAHVLRSHAARLDCHAEETAVQGMYVSSSSRSCFSLLTLCSVLALPPACTPLPPGVLSLLVAAFALAPLLGLALAGWLALAALPDPLELTLEDAPRCCAPFALSARAWACLSHSATFASQWGDGDVVVSHEDSCGLVIPTALQTDCGLMSPRSSDDCTACFMRRRASETLGAMSCCRVREVIARQNR
mmetsp:Transcript_48339/g.160194  ORF Transcript_48339/g.160194 Transcript_48339/m.160194 type:complete len:297 (-) Transcript_48339:21-911(-)